MPSGNGITADTPVSLVVGAGVLLIDHAYVGPSIDNNLSERTLRRVGIGRKNYLFFGADSGGHTAAAMYSIVATCDRHQIEPWRYLTDVLERLGELREPLRRAAKAEDTAALDALLEPLLPDVWKRSHPEAHVADVHNLGQPHRHRR